MTLPINAFMSHTEIKYKNICKIYDKMVDKGKKKWYISVV